MKITNFHNRAEATTLGIPIILFAPCNADMVGHEQYLLRQLGQHSPGLITGFLHLMLGHWTGRHCISPCCNKTKHSWQISSILLHFFLYQYNEFYFTLSWSLWVSKLACHTVRIWKTARTKLWVEYLYIRKKKEHENEDSGTKSIKVCCASIMRCGKDILELKTTVFWRLKQTCLCLII